VVAAFAIVTTQHGGDRLSTAIPDPVDLTRRLIAFNTVNPPGNERACAEFLADVLATGGFDVALHELATDRASLVATRRRSSARPPLVFTGHIDVVPLGTRAWSYDPFSATVVADRIYGRGSSDMKSGVAAFVCAALEDARDNAQGAELTLIITSGEETGCVGAASLLAGGHLGPAGAIIVGEPTGNAVCVGHKGALWLNAITSGITAHGSMPEKGDNAIYKAADVIAKLKAFAFAADAHATLGAPTLSVNTVRGGLNINSVPDRAEIGVDIRTIPSVDHGALRNALQAHIGQQAQLEVFLDLPGVWSSPEGAWVRYVVATVEKITGAAAMPGAATFFSDASVLTPAMGMPPTIILGPGESGQAHQTDEWCSTDKIRAAAKIYAHVLRDWASANRM
jgi:succinyl-diaminopimelate desuccinylase